MDWLSCHLLWETPSISRAEGCSPANHRAESCASPAPNHLNPECSVLHAIVSASILPLLPWGRRGDPYFLIQHRDSRAWPGAQHPGCGDGYTTIQEDQGQAHTASYNLGDPGRMPELLRSSRGRHHLQLCSQVRKWPTARSCPKIPVWKADSGGATHALCALGHVTLSLGFPMCTLEGMARKSRSSQSKAWVRIQGLQSQQEGPELLWPL